MKQTFIVVLFLLGVLAYSQSKPKFKVNSVNTGFGGFYTKNSTEENGGATFFIDAIFSVNKNLISTSYQTGAEIGIVGNSNFKFNEIGLFFGRDIEITNWFHLEPFVGIGNYNQKQYTSSSSTISYPIKLNTKFYFNKSFGMGINNNYSFNKINNNLTINLLFHYKF